MGKCGLGAKKRVFEGTRVGVGVGAKERVFEGTRVGVGVGAKERVFEGTWVSVSCHLMVLVGSLVWPGGLWLPM